MAAFRPGPSGYWTQAIRTTTNAATYALSFGNRLHLEGRHTRGRRWHNWTFGEDSRATVHQPRTEAEIVELVSTADRLRVVGSGHSFNAAVRCDTLISLDRYAGIVEDFDHSHLPQEAGITHARVRAGMRMRDVNRELYRRGLAIVALPSHNAQSIAGVLATDVHGTGRDVGFVSASVVGLRIVDGTGSVHDVWSGDELFRAAIGGIGAVGIITEVSLRCVPRFNIRQRTDRIPLDQAKAEWRDVLKAHEHVNFYVFPFAKYCQLHRWDATDEARSKWSGFREWITITKAALMACWIGDFVAWSKLLPRLTNISLRMQPNSNLVMESANGFNRTVYHMHQELEFAVPAERTWEVIDHLVELYEGMYGEQRMPFTLFEVRFTPADGTEGLISPASGREQHMWVTIAASQSAGYAEYFAAVEEYMREINAPPHLGKWCESLTSADMASMHGDAFGEFLELRRRHDPHGRFANEFTDRLFGPIESPAEAGV